MSEKDFKIVEIDHGFCRIVYVALNEDGKKVYYCLQDEGENCGGVVCYRTCGPDHEPSYPIVYARNRFEVPTGNSLIETAVRDYLAVKE